MKDALDLRAAVALMHFALAERLTPLLLAALLLVAAGIHLVNRGPDRRAAAEPA